MTSEARHTPGPWRLVGDTVAEVIGPRDEDVGCNVLLSQQANARLIAAAPDLLDLVRRIMGAPSRLQPTVVEEARALLARIEGGV